MLLLTILGSLHSVRAQEILGSWQNDLGSILVIDSISQQGILSGEYRSSSGVDGRVFPMQGWLNSSEQSASTAITFSVHWGDYGSITSWSGYIDSDSSGRYIKTLWHLVRPGEKEPWERIITNASTFRPDPSFRK